MKRHTHWLPLLLVLLLGLACCALVACPADDCGPEDVTTPAPTIETADAFTIDRENKTITLNGTLRNSITTYDLRNRFHVSDGAVWRVYSTEDCRPSTIIAGQIVSLAEGSNAYYVQVTNTQTEESAIWRVNIYRNRRLPIRVYYNETALYTTVEAEENQLVRDSFHTANPFPVFEKADYTSDGVFYMDTICTEPFDYDTYVLHDELNLYVNAVYHGVRMVSGHVVGIKPTEGILRSIVIPDTATYIDTGAFEDQTGLSSIVIGSGVTGIGARAFKNCTGLTSLVLPARLETIAANAFVGCYRLTEIYNLSEHLTVEVGKDENGGVARYAACVHTAADEASHLHATPDGFVYYRPGTDAAEELVAYLGEDVDVVVPDGVAAIRAYAFYRNTALQSVVLPASVEYVAQNAFLRCSEMKTLTLGDNIRVLDSDAFRDCRMLTTLYYTGTLSDWCTITFGNAMANPMYYTGNLYIGDAQVTELALPAGLAEIGAYTFENLKALTTLTLPDTVVRIGASAFEGCTGLARVALPAGLTTVDARAFYGCAALPCVTLPLSVTDVGHAAFGGNETLFVCCEATTPAAGWAEDMCDAAAPRYDGAVEQNGIIYRISGTAAVVLHGLADLTAADIPADITIGGVRYSVLSIADAAFRDCTALTTVRMADSVQSIGHCAFEGCTALETVAFSAGIEKIGHYAFRNCVSLISAELPAACHTLGYGAFSGCEELSTVILPAGLTSMESDVFRGCTSLSVENQAGCLYLGKWLIGMDGTVTGSLVLRADTVGIASQAFADCTGLTDVYIPASVLYIGADAFARCTAAISCGASACPAGWDAAWSYPGCEPTWGASAPAKSAE